MNTTLCYGPFTPHFSLPTPDIGAISTNLFVYNLLFLDDTFPSLTPYIDVRDVARAHLRALHSPLTSQVG
jgi:nucleoside-diphosphate-sugar epimerase